MRAVVLSILLFSFCAEAADVSFDREIEISARTRVTVADLARFDDVPEAIVKDLSQTELPRLDASTLRRVIREKKAGNAQYESVRFTIPAELSVHTVSGYSAAEFRRKLMNHLASLCGDCEFEVLPVRDAGVRIGDEWRIDTSTVKLAPSYLVTLIDDKARAAWIPVQMKIFREVLVARKTVMVNEKIGPDNVEIVRKEVSAVREPLTSLSDFGAAVARRVLSAGHIVAATDVQAPMLVRRGQALKVSVSSGDFEITSSATAEENGRAGEVVKVRTLDSGRILSAEVVSEGWVKVR